MKKITLASFLLLGVCFQSMAQLPVTSGLSLHLNAASGYNDNGAAASTWQDLSPAGNHVTSGAGAGEPVYFLNAGGSGFPGVKFDGTSDYMTRAAGATSSWNSTAATLFVVRIAPTASNTIDPSFNGARSTVSIAENGSFNNEFGLMGNWAIHTTSSGNWLRKDHQCYTSLPNNLPVLTTGAYNTGAALSDINYYVNGIASTNASVIEPTPTPYAAVSRGILIGGRYSSGFSIQGTSYFNGYILEVVAYNRLLTSTEIASVNDYLKCKYKINYQASFCNAPITCTPVEGCNDLCYWRVTGNNINTGNNTFGTLSNDDVEIQTNSSNRGIMTKVGLLGWNTMSPTALLHVNCAGNNTGEGGMNSDIRFENLEGGTGSILAIDANGYVHNTGIPVGMTSGTYWDINGNSIGSGNFFGTTNGQDIRIRTWNMQRGVITAGTSAASTTSGFFGWNTAAPTARFHVNCFGGNEIPGTSDIRFENLESGNGTLLAIDAQGYVYNTGKTLPKGGGTAWEVTGNNITGGNNFFGTNTPDDVILRTSGIDKGKLTSGMAGIPNDDGRLGWQTLNPTAHLHINCAGGNPDGGPESDVRFEELESGMGNILVIDDKGYVYNSRVMLNPDGIMGAQKKKIEDLETQIKTLTEKIEQLSAGTTKADVVTPTGNQNRLFQNVPNPFDKNTTIEYYLYNMEREAYVMIYDLNGRELLRYPIQQKGSGKVIVNGDNLVAGVYMYSLVIDGREFDSKRMILSK